MQQSSQEWIVYPGRGRLWGLTLASTAFAAFGVFCMAAGVREGQWAVAWIGLASFACFGLTLLYLGDRLIRRKPSLIISDRGIIDNSFYLAAGEILWEDIAGFEVYHYLGQGMLGIRLKDPHLLYNRASGFKRWMIGVNRKLVPAQINIPRNAVSIPLEKVLEEMVRRAKGKVEGL